MEGFSVILLLTCVFVLSTMYANERDRKENLKKLETKFLLGSAHLLQFKYHMLEMLKIIYDKAAETDEQFSKDYQKIVESVDAKFNQMGDEWIKQLQETVEYELEYKNWEEATKYIDSLMKFIKESTKNDTGKGN